MAQNQREINRLKHIIEEKDREIEMLRDNEESSGRVDPGISEEFSNRVAELEGMVKELAVSNTQTEPQDTRITELEEMVKMLAVSRAPAAPRDTRVNELEGMVKGLTEELLDLKAEVRKLGKVLEGKEELKPRPEARRARPAPERVVKGRPEKSSQPIIRPAEPEPSTVTIMQPDGTLAEEPRRNTDDLIVAGNRPAKIYQPKVNREYRGKEEKKPLIYAEDDDTVEIKKK